MTREELTSIARGFADTHTISRFKSCLSRFNDCSSFLTASEGDMMKAYVEARPKSGKGLGRKFWQLMNKLRAEVKERAFRTKKELEEKQRIEAEQKRIQEAEQKAREAEFFTYKQLRAITAFMELGGIEKIDLRAFRAFCESVHVSPDLTKENKQSAETPVDDAGAIGGKVVAA